MKTASSLVFGFGNSGQFWEWPALRFAKKKLRDFFVISWKLHFQWHNLYFCACTLRETLCSWANLSWYAHFWLEPSVHRYLLTLELELCLYMLSLQNIFSQKKCMRFLWCWNSLQDAFALKVLFHEFVFNKLDPATQCRSEMGLFIHCIYLCLLLLGIREDVGPLKVNLTNICTS